MSFVSKSKTKFAPKIRKRAPKPAAKPVEPPPEPSVEPGSKESSVSTSVSESSPLENLEKREALLKDDVPATSAAVEPSPVQSSAPKDPEPTSESPKKKRKLVIKSHIIKAPEPTDMLKMVSGSRKSSVGEIGSLRSRRLTSISRMEKPGSFLKQTLVEKHNIKGKGAIVLTPLSHVPNDNADGKTAKPDAKIDGYKEFLRFSRTRANWITLTPNKRKKSAKSKTKTKTEDKDEADLDILQLAGEKVKESDSQNKVKKASTPVTVIVPENIEDNPPEEANKEASNEATNAEKEDDVHDLPFNEDIQIVVDPITKKLRATRKEEYEKFSDYFDEIKKILSLSQIPRGLTKVKPELTEDFEIDQELFSMAELCAPSLPMGKVSQDYQLAKQAESKRKSEASKRKRMRIEAREMGIPYETLLKEDENPEEREKRRREEVNKLLDTEPAPSHQNPKLSIADGEIVLNTESQLVDTRRNLNFDGQPREVENENPYENPVHSKSFGKNTYSDRWTLSETASFYRALSTWGTDFAVIANLFPHRTRRQVKRKFTLEERRHGALIELALSHKLPADFESFVTGVNLKKGENERIVFKLLEEFNKELEEERKKHQESIKAILDERKKAKEEDLQSMKEKEDRRKMNGENKLSLRAQRLRELRANEEVIGEI